VAGLRNSELPPPSSSCYDQVPRNSGQDLYEIISACCSPKVVFINSTKVQKILLTVSSSKKNAFVVMNKHEINNSLIISLAYEVDIEIKNTSAN